MLTISIPIDDHRTTVAAFAEDMLGDTEARALVDQCIHDCCNGVYATTSGQPLIASRKDVQVSFEGAVFAPENTPWVILVTQREDGDHDMLAAFNAALNRPLAHELARNLGYQFVAGGLLPDEDLLRLETIGLADVYDRSVPADRNSYVY